MIARDATYTAERLVMCPGPWAPRLLADLGPMTLERMVHCWFAPLGGVSPYLAEHHPIYIWEGPRGRRLHGFPSLGDEADGLEVAFLRSGTPTTPETLDRTVGQGEIAEIAEFAGRRLPALPGTVVRAMTRMYTATPDRHFMLGRHPWHQQVTVGCGLSGPGFAFVPVIGEVLAELSLDGATRHPIGLFDPARCTAPPA